MNQFRSIIDQVITIWNDSTGAARVGLVLLASILVAGIIGIGIWSAQPEYRVLHANLPISKTNSVISTLNQENIDFELKGTQLWVNKNQMTEAAAALSDLGLSKGDSPKPLMENAISTPLQSKRIDRTNLELQIEAAIESMEAIGSADVLINPEGRSYGLRRGSTASASVTLSLVSMDFDEASAKAVAKTVANAVPGLDINNVSVIDTTGYEYEFDKRRRSYTKRDELRRKLEDEKVRKAIGILRKPFGAENVDANVSITMKYEDSETQSTTFDVENAVTVYQKTITEETKNARGDAFGDAGIQSNRNGGTSPTSFGVSTIKEDLEQKTEVPKEITTSRSNNNEIASMTVSVLINDSALPEGKDKDEEIKLWTEVVGTSIGIDTTRNDSINLEFVPFLPSPEPEPVAAPFPWEQIHEILRNISLGLAGLVAFLLVFMTFRKFSPSQPTAPNPVLTSRKAQLEKLSEMVKEHPEVFNQIVAAWSKNESRPEGSEATEAPRTRAA